MGMCRFEAYKYYLRALMPFVDKATFNVVKCI